MEKYSFFDNFDSKNNIIGFVFLNAIEDFYYDSVEILNDLSLKYGDEYSVVVDLFLTNGFSFNRFLKIDYNKGKYNKQLLPVTDIDSWYETKFSIYLKNNFNLLDNSSLSKRVVDYLKKELL